MKTLTEFSGFVLKEAISKKTALLAEGKTEEEVQTALNELMKLDEAKVGFYKNVVDMTSSRVDRVKRVVVALKANDQEKVPESYIEREGHFYLVEYFPQAEGNRPRSDHGGRGDRDRNGRGRSGGRDRDSRDRPSRDRPSRDRGSEERSSRPPRREATGSFAPANPAAEKTPSQRPARPKGPRPPRAPRAPRAPQGPRGAGELRLVLKGQSATTLPGSGTAPSANATASGEPQQA